MSITLEDWKQRAIAELRDIFAPEVDVVPFVETPQRIREVIANLDAGRGKGWHRRDKLVACCVLAMSESQHELIKAAE